MTKKIVSNEKAESNLMSNDDAIKELEERLEKYSKDHNELTTMIHKSQGALDVLKQLKEGIEKPNDTKPTN